MALTKVRGSGLDSSQEGAITFNEGSADVDFRVESNGNTHALFVDAGNDKVGVGTSSPDGALHVKGISDHGRIVLESGGTSGSDNNMFMQFHNGGGTEIAQIEIGEGASNEGQIAFKTGGTTTAMTIDKDGHITKPLQSAFLAHTSTTRYNLAINNDHTLILDTERFDQNSDYNNSNYRFTAPVTGKYQFNLTVYMNQVPTNASYIQTYIVTSNRVYYAIVDTEAYDASHSFFTLNHSVLADMDANDTCHSLINQGGGTVQLDYTSDTHLSGFLVC